ncbi:response regulator [candidate division KSB1 bacterium]|jgi:DNA-binding response OmpR family regulator|nr:response regulator [candidate division KSB1 bacterium]
MAKILIVEDEKEMAIGLKDNFEFDGHNVSIASDGEEGLVLAESETPDLIILDVMLPKKSGFDVCRELRAKGVRIPIIMLTARGQEIDKVLGLELGADDYITKPFSVRELLARVKAVMRRSSEQEETNNSVIKIGPVNVNFGQYKAWDDNGGTVDFSYKEFEILKYFIDHQNQIITRDALLNDVWGYEVYPSSRTVDNFIVKLRKKIEPDPNHPKHILTVYGIGYKYIP